MISYIVQYSSNNISSSLKQQVMSEHTIINTKYGYSSRGVGQSGGDPNQDINTLCKDRRKL